MTDRKKFAAAVPWILFLVAMVFTNVFPRYVLSPLLLRIAEAFSMGYDRASSVFLIASLGFISGLLLSGYVSRWLTHRWTIVAAVGMCGGSLLLLSFAGSFAIFLPLLFLVGASNGLYPGSGIASVQHIAGPKHRGKALGLHEAGPNIALISAPLLAAALAPTAGWRGIFRIVGAIALLSSAAFALIGRASPDRGEPPHLENLRMLAKSRAFLALTAILTVGGTAAVGVYSILPTYLVVGHGMAESFANTVVGLSRVVTFGSMLAAGAFSDRLGFRPVAAVVLPATGAVTAILGLTTGSALVFFVVLQPTVVGAFFPLCWVALSDAVPLRARNLSVSLAIALSNLFAAGLSPRVLAALGAAGYFRQSFVVLGALIAAGTLLLLLVPKRRLPPEVDRR